MNPTRKLWIAFIIVIGLSLLVLGYFGFEIYQKGSPIPEKVVTEQGDIVFTGQDIRDGMNVWQSMGGQEMRTFWATEVMWHLTGRPTGSIVRRFLY